MIAPTLQLHDATWDCVLPRPAHDSFAWAVNNVRMPDGAPFDEHAFPWTRGIAEAWDDPSVRTIWLQFAARLGKTAIAQALMVSAISHNPAAALFGTSTETLAKQTIKKKLFPILEETPAIRPWLPPEHRRLQTRVDLSTCTIYVAWSGSVTTLADISARYKHANEVDKWDTSSSTEADPLELFAERGAELPDRKEIYESTPALVRSSRIARGLANGWNCRWYVPCPLCGHFQMLIRNVDRQAALNEGGLIWDSDEGSHSTPAMAYATARYICAGCKKELHDEHRRPMIQRGIWVPEGQRVTKRGKLVGQMTNPGPDASFQLSRLYAPTFTFGDYAQAFVKACRAKDDATMQNFVNSWEGMPWAAKRFTAEWQDVAAKLCTERKAGVIPSDAVFLTSGVDVQVDHYVYVVVAWRPNQHGSVIAYGIVPHRNGLAGEFLDSWWPYEDGKDESQIVMTLVDCGFDKDAVHADCRGVNQHNRWVWPSRGSRQGELGGQSFKKTRVDTDQSAGSTNRHSLKNMFEITVSSPYWQSWLHNCIFTRKPGNPNSIDVHAGAMQDMDFWTQAMNEMPGEKVDQTGHIRSFWEVIDESIPVDFRDALRYCRCAAEVYTSKAWHRLTERRIGVKQAGGSPRKESNDTRKSKWINRTIKPRRSRYR